MKTYLLDINVLIALAWPVHTHHASTTRWFLKKGRSSWATCPITQCGFVRISSNAAIIKDAVRPELALSLIKEMTSDPGHHFWTDDVSITDSQFVFSAMLTGHRQVNDAYLLALAKKRNGVLATLDKGILVLDKGEGRVELIA